MVLIAESVAGADILEAHTCAYVAAANHLLSVLLVGVHLEQTAHALFLTRTGVEHVASGNNVAAVHAEECQTTHIRVGRDLERKSTHRSFARRLTGLNLIGARGIVTLYSTGVERRRQVCAHTVEQRLNTLVLERRSADHRHDLHRESTLAESATDLILADSRGIVEIFLHQSVVKLGDLLKHLVAILLSLVHQIGRDILHRILGTHGLVVPEDSLHADQIHNALECLLGADRYLDRAGIGSEHLLELAAHFEEVCARTVHLVNIADTGNIILVSLAPYGFRLRLYTAHSTECGHSSVEHTQRTLHLHSEVNVSRSVDKIDLVLFVGILPECCGCSRCDGDATLLLLLHPVHGGAAVVHLTYFVSQTRIEKYALGRRRLAGVDMSHNADITGVLQLFVRFSH